MSNESRAAVADDPSEKGGEATLHNESNNGTGSDESLVARLDDLEALFDQYIRDYLEEQVSQQLTEHEERIDELERQLESIAGLADGETSNREKRAVDVAMSLVRQARNRVDADQYAMWWKDVQDTLATLGHGPDVHKPWCFDAMEDVACADGFGMTTVQNPDNREVKAVKVNLAELPAEDRSTVSNDITTGIGETPGQSSPKTESQTTET